MRFKGNFPKVSGKPMKTQLATTLTLGKFWRKVHGSRLTFDTAKFLEDGSLHKLSGSVDYPSTTASFHTDSLNKVLIHKRPLTIGMQVKVRQ